MDEPILYTRDGAVATLTFNLPSRLNPMAMVLQKALLEALTRVRDDRGVRVLVITGAGRAFCVGADLDEMRGKIDGPGSAGVWTGEMMRQWTNPIVAQLRSLPVPVLTAVNGPAAGAGVGLALAGDVVVAAQSAYFYLSFLPRLGVLPDAGATWFIPRLAGAARAMGMALLDHRVSAATAAQWGLIWEAVEDAEFGAATKRLAAKLAALPPHAITEARAAFAAAGTNSLEAQLEYETTRQIELIDGSAFEEGVKAFLEKRPPVFAAR
jgi:2-(1,2-epoxy-1,2-dihydrophenyl)acetyl-CoA isomerase